MNATDFQRVIDIVHEWWSDSFREVLVNGQLALTDDHDRCIINYITRYASKPSRSDLLNEDLAFECQRRGTLHCHHMILSLIHI